MRQCGCSDADPDVHSRGAIAVDVRSRIESIGSAKWSAAPSSSPPAAARDARWLRAGDLQEARNATSVVIVGTDDVLVVGSDYETSWQSACGAATGGSDSVEIGDRAATRWRKTASLPTPREAPAVVGLRDGRVLVTGGERGENDGNVSYSSTYVFDPSQKAWTKSGLMNSARSSPASALLADGRVLVAGGRYVDFGHDVRFLDSTEVWDPGDREMVADRATRYSACRGICRRRWPMDGSWSSAALRARTALRPSWYRQRSMTPNGGRGAQPGACGRRGAASCLSRWLTAGRSSRAASRCRRTHASRRWSGTTQLPTDGPQPGPFPMRSLGRPGIQLADGRVLLAGGSQVDAELVDADAGTYVSGLTADAVLFDPRIWRVDCDGPDAQPARWRVSRALARRIRDPCRRVG